jgi:FlaA1/EpsC-like NDP-sugar epimerase
MADRRRDPRVDIPLAGVTPSLEAAVVGRDASFLAEDYLAGRPTIEAAVTGRRVLVVGGAGSIGAMATELLCAFHPVALHVLDVDENGLAELVRDFRSRGLAPPDLRALPLDYGSPVVERLLRESPPYDLVMNFAALKHVRSEKDVYSLLSMIDTNVVKHATFLGWLARDRHAERYFAVSTDKAANPTSLMGASKRLMEDVVFASPAAVATSARFANVAFSNGSLLQSFLLRLAKRQPLAVPRDTRRYFISIREAGEICLLAAAVARHGHVLVPRLDPETDLQPLERVAAATLRHFGFEPALYEDVAAAFPRVPDEMTAGRYPLVLTPLDTSGEKPYEEFWGEDESPLEVGLKHLLAVPHVPPPPETLSVALRRLAGLVAEATRAADKADVVETIGRVVPTFRHRETGRSLDDRA